MRKLSIKFLLIMLIHFGCSVSVLAQTPVPLNDWINQIATDYNLGNSAGWTAIMNVSYMTAVQGGSVTIPIQSCPDSYGGVPLLYGGVSSVPSFFNVSNINGQLMVGGFALPSYIYAQPWDTLTVNNIQDSFVFLIFGTCYYTDMNNQDPSKPFLYPNIYQINPVVVTVGPPPPPQPGNVDLFISAISLSQPAGTPVPTDANSNSIIATTTATSATGPTQVQALVTVNLSGATTPVTTDLQITLGGQQLTSQSVTLNPGGNQIAINFTPPTDPGLLGVLSLTAIVNSGQTVQESDYSNNGFTMSVNTMVLCKVEDSGRAVPFYSQAQIPWNTDPFGPYGAGYNPKHYMQGYGCYLTDIDMVLSTYGINNTVSGLYIPVGSEVAANSGGLVSLTPGSLNDAGKVEMFDGQYTMFDKNNDPINQGIVNYARLAAGSSCVANGGDIATCSAQMLSQVSFKPDQMSYNQNTVQQQICAGNPVILSLAIPATAANPAHNHFVLATAMTVDTNGNPSYIVNDPGKNSVKTGRNQNLYELYPSSINPINGQRLFVNKADPSFFEVRATSHGTSYVVTDSQGRRSGYNPITNQNFNEILGASYYSEFSPNEDPTSTAPDQLPTQIFYSGNAIDGSYTIDVYSTIAGTAELSITGYDLNGQINQVQPISQAISNGGHVQVIYQHSSQALVTGKLDLKLIRRLSQERDNDEGLLLKGKILLPVGTTYADLTRSFSISVGTFSRNFQASYFKTIHHHGEIEYVLNEKHSRGSSVILKNDGSFRIVIRDLDLPDSVLKSPIQVDMQIDNLYATSHVNIKKECDNDDKKREPLSNVKKVIDHKKAEGSH